MSKAFPSSQLASLAMLASVMSCSAAPPADPSAIVLDPPAFGVQLATPAFDVSLGQERQHCYWMKLDSDADLYVTRIVVQYLAGSHHMNLFQTDNDVPDHDGDCLTGVFGPMGTNGYELVVGSQRGSLDWQLPAGVAFKLKARRQLMLQTHYVNASTQRTPTGVGRVKVNLHAEPDAAKITSLMGTMFANNVNIRIPPRESRGFTTSCPFTQDAHLVAVTGHFHSRGRAFSVNLSPDGRQATDEIYRSRDWDEPPFTVLSQEVFLPAGGGLQYTCEFRNETDAEIKFGPKVETDEHCNLFAYYYPAADGRTRYCF